MLFLGAHLSAAAAAAAERIHMPFDCRFDGARVELVPSPERSYAILGPHQSEIYSACSPADPNRCRSWFVHRFDLDCNGARVSWLDVAEAALRYDDRPAWVEDGRFHLRMGPLWTFGGGNAFREGQRRWMREPYSPRGELGGGFGAGPERPSRSERIVTMPPGYAPTQGISVTFSGSVAETPPPAPVAQVAAPEPEPIPDLPKRAPRAEIAAAKVAPPPESPAREKPERAPAAQEVATAKEAKAATADTQSGDSLEPTIINAPQASGAQSGQPPRQHDQQADAPAPTETASTQPAQPQPQQEKKQDKQADSPAPAETASAAATDIATGSTQTTVADAATTRASDATQALPSFAPPPAPSSDKTIVTPVTIAAAVALALAALAAATGFWRRGPDFVRVTPPAGRDFGNISFDSPRPTAPSLGASLTLSSRAPAPQSDTDTPAIESGPESAPDFPIPSTYEQALDVLGASPDASLPAIKKIVDGLRQNWHPDHARSESDRLYRESRSRQINVAWDLVSQRRSAA